MFVILRSVVKNTFFVVFDGSSWRSSRLIIARDPAREEDGILLRVVGWKITSCFTLSSSSACLGSLFAFPCSRVVKPVARKLVLRAIK